MLILEYNSNYSKTSYTAVKRSDIVTICYCDTFKAIPRQCHNIRNTKINALTQFSSMGKKKKVSKHLNVSSASSSASPVEFNRSASMPAEKFSKATRGIPVSPEAIAEIGYVQCHATDPSLKVDGKLTVPAKESTGRCFSSVHPMFCQLDDIGSTESKQRLVLPFAGHVD